jgi:hypothetical protein
MIVQRGMGEFDGLKIQTILVIVQRKILTFNSHISIQIRTFNTPWVSREGSYNLQSAPVY